MVLLTDMVLFREVIVNRNGAGLFCEVVETWETAVNRFSFTYPHSSCHNLQDYIKTLPDLIPVRYFDSMFPSKRLMHVK